MKLLAAKFKPLPIGIDNFEMLITRGYYFIDKTLLDALKQIKDKGYDMELKSEGKNIIRYGISFCEKDCYVKLADDFYECKVFDNM